MNTPSTEIGTVARPSEALKVWSAPKLETLSLALNTLTADVSGNADGGKASLSTSKT